MRWAFSFCFLAKYHNHQASYFSTILNPIPPSFSNSYIPNIMMSIYFQDISRN